jgi:MerR family transcriptional regulator/heat shock protein HspR
MNLAGVEKVFELEGEIARMKRRMRSLERQAERVEKELGEELDRVRRSFRAELVPYQPPGKALLPAEQAVKVRVERPRR